jgi:hypothetical protein
MIASRISALVLCRRCLGRTGQLDENCLRCGGIDAGHWGIDPVSFEGCVHDQADDEEQNSVSSS